MTISEKYFEELPLNRYDAALKIISEMQNIRNARNLTKAERFKQLISRYALLLEIKTKIKETVDIDWEVAFSDDLDSNIEAIMKFTADFKNLINKAVEKQKIKEEISSMDEIRESFRAHLGELFSYNFTDAEIKLIQERITNLRQIISESKYIEPEHRQRLLNKLEKLQQELHKKMSNLDRFWGMVGESGVILGKFGKDVKPLVQEIKELANIFWRVQTRAEGIEYKELTPFLEKLDKIDEKE